VHDDDGNVLAALDISQASPPASGRATRIEGDDALDAESLRMQVALGGLAVEVVRLVIDADADVGRLLGCTTLADWLEDQGIEGSEACDEACFDAVCARARVRLLATAEPALMDVDIARPEIELSGTLRLSDEDGDLRVDVIEAVDLRGGWLSAVEGGSSAVLSGSGRAAALLASE
jgi:hypothetical protein